MITLSQTKQVGSTGPGVHYSYNAPSTSHIEMDPSWLEWIAGAGLSATSAYIKQPAVDKSAGLFGEGRALGTQLSFLKFAGERGAYTGEAPGEFEFSARAMLSTFGEAPREIRICGTAQPDDRTPLMFRGAAVPEEGYTWEDIRRVFQVHGVLERPSKTRARHSSPSRAYNACAELATWLELSNDELAKILDISRTTLSMSWKKGVEPHNKAKARRIYELHSVVGALHNTLGTQLAGWLKQGRPCPLKLLEQRKYEVFERRADEVIFATSRPPRPRLDTTREPRPPEWTTSERASQLKPAGRARSKRLAR